VTKPFYLSRRGRVWYVRFRDPAGTILSARSSGKTNRTAAEAWAREQAKHLTAGGDISLREWAERFFIPGCPHGDRVRLEGKLYSKRTEANYRGTLERDVLPDPIMGKRLCDLRRGDLLAFRSRMVAKRGPRRAAQVAYSVLRLVIKEALFAELLERDPTLGIGQLAYAPRIRRALSLKELRVVLDPTRYANPVHWRATMIAALTGLRAGEVRGLQWADLDPAGIIEVRHNLPGEATALQPPKWGKMRLTPYPRALRALLEPLRGDGWVCSIDGGPMSYKHWAAAFRRAARAAGVQATLHGLRHSLLTLLRDRGVPDEKLRGSFGWSGPKMLENYTHRELYDMGDQSAAMDILFKAPPPRA
jgi:integrase